MIAELVSVEQYLHTSYEHDAEFVGGRIVERSMPTWEHGRVQTFLAMTLGAMEKCAGFFTATEQRIRTRADRFRVPDVCVVLEKPSGAAGRRVVTDPPYLCVEILSPEDTAQEVRDKVGEYLTFGVKWVWVIDPITCGGEIYTVDKIFSLKDRVFTTDRFRVDLNQVEF